MTLKPTDADRERARELYPMKAACQVAGQADADGVGHSEQQGTR